MRKPVDYCAIFHKTYSIKRRWYQIISKSNIWKYLSLYVHIAGYYWIDPNEGCVSDAEYVYCDFENKRACVQPKKENVRLLSSGFLILFMIAVNSFHLSHFRIQ